MDWGAAGEIVGAAGKVVGVNRLPSEIDLLAEMSQGPLDKLVRHVQSDSAQMLNDRTGLCNHASALGA